MYALPDAPMPVSLARLRYWVAPAATVHVAVGAGYTYVLPPNVSDAPVTDAAPVPVLVRTMSGAVADVAHVNVSEVNVPVLPLIEDPVTAMFAELVAVPKRPKM